MYEGIPAVVSRFHVQRASNAESVPMPWRHDIDGLTHWSYCSLALCHRHWVLFMRLWVAMANGQLGSCGRLNFEDDIFKRIFLNENVAISFQISLTFVPRGPIDNKSVLVQVMAWRQTGDKPLPEPRLTWFTDAYMQHSREMSLI